MRIPGSTGLPTIRYNTPEMPCKEMVEYVGGQLCFIHVHLTKPVTLPQTRGHWTQNKLLFS